jgi:hypothetical protein
MVPVVPSGIDIEKRAVLAGEKSAGQEHHLLVGLSPAKGWLVIADLPDPERRFWKRLKLIIKFDRNRKSL